MASGSASLLDCCHSLFGLVSGIEDRDNVAGRVKHAEEDLAILEELFLEFLAMPLFFRLVCRSRRSR
jgi:hypothetical protein